MEKQNLELKVVLLEASLSHLEGKVLHLSDCITKLTTVITMQNEEIENLKRLRG